MIFNLMKPVPVAEPTMYLYGHEADKTVSYNGVVLPELPVWDKTAYPYAEILPSPYQNRYMLYIENVKATADGSTLTWTGLIRTSYVCALGDTEWTLEMEAKEWGDYFGSYSSIVWCNYEMLNKDGSVYLSASDPVTTYENADVTINGVGYVGAVLPKLPVWDKEKYPYVGIFFYQKSITDSTPLYVLLFLSQVATVGIANILFSGGGSVKSYELLGDETDWRFVFEGDVEEGNRILEETTTNTLTLSESGWANHDIPNEDGSIFMSASGEPIPVYE